MGIRVVAGVQGGMGSAGTGILSCLTQMLGTEFRSPGSIASALNVPVPKGYFKNLLPLAKIIL